MRTPDADRKYIRALRFRWLTPLYDALISKFLYESTFKHALIEQSSIEGTEMVLDIGSGTGTLLLMIKMKYPAAVVTGLDGDAEIITIARGKFAQHRSNGTFVQAYANSVPFANSTFDRVFTSLMLHHLSTEHKRQTLAEALRILRPGGELHIADWTKPKTVMANVGFAVVRHLDGREQTSVNADGRMGELVSAAGFIDVSETRHFSTILGTIGFIEARKAHGLGT